MSSDKPKKEKMSKKKPNTDTQEDLLAEIERLRMENAYLKKLNALVQERIARENGRK
jgi:transposase